MVLSDARLAVLVPHLYEGVPLLQAAAAAGGAGTDCSTVAGPTLSAWNRWRPRPQRCGDGRGLSCSGSSAGRRSSCAS